MLLSCGKEPCIGAFLLPFEPKRWPEDVIREPGCRSVGCSFDTGHSEGALREPENADQGDERKEDPLQEREGAPSTGYRGLTLIGFRRGRTHPR
jgi:hypothetical protein